LKNVYIFIDRIKIIEPLGHKPGFLNTLMAVLVGYLANLAVPRIGEITRCGVIKRYEKLPLDSVFGTVVVERIMDTILLMIVSVITIVWQFDVLSTKLKEAYDKINQYDKSVNRLSMWTSDYTKNTDMLGLVNMSKNGTDHDIDKINYNTNGDKGY
jgi:hypothetical protein